MKFSNNVSDVLQDVFLRTVVRTFECPTEWELFDAMKSAKMVKDEYGNLNPVYTLWPGKAKKLMRKYPKWIVDERPLA